MIERDLSAHYISMCRMNTGICKRSSLYPRLQPITAMANQMKFRFLFMLKVLHVTESCDWWMIVLKYKIVSFQNNQHAMIMHLLVIISVNHFPSFQISVLITLLLFKIGLLLQR